MGDFLRRSTWLFGLIAASGAAVGAALFACIPDLAPLADVPDAAFEATAPPDETSYCGDGIIDLDRGEECDPGVASPSCSPACKVVCTGDGDGAAGAVNPANDHCYYQAGDAANLTTAQGACTRGAHIVTFASDDEWRFVTSRFSSPEPIWVGLQRSGTSVPFESVIAGQEPGWTPTYNGYDCAGCYVYEDDASAELPRHPLPDGAMPPPQECVVGYPGDTSWTEQACNQAKTTTARVICEREPEGTLIDRCNGVFCFKLVRTQKDKRYVFVPNTATHDDAVSACAALGGRLVVLQSREEREQLWHELLKLTPQPPQIWIGLAQRTEAGAGWTWEDGTAVDEADAYPPPWASKEPTAKGTRAFAVQSNAWDTELAHTTNDPTVTSGYVCELPLTDAGQ